MHFVHNTFFLFSLSGFFFEKFIVYKVCSLLSIRINDRTLLISTLRDAHISWQRNSFAQVDNTTIWYKQTDIVAYTIDHPVLVFLVCI